MRPHIFPLSKLDVIKKMSFTSRNSLYAETKSLVNEFHLKNGYFFVAALGYVPYDADKECRLFLCGFSVGNIRLITVEGNRSGSSGGSCISSAFVPMTDEVPLFQWTRKVADAFAKLSAEELSIFNSRLKTNVNGFFKYFRRAV